MCNKPYEYCHGRIRIPYFRHSEKDLCEDLYSESETQEHINGKIDLYEWIQKQPFVTDVVLEGWMPLTKQRPDIMFKYFSKTYVIEYQCTPIATEYFERHELYQAAGIIDIWICGTEKYLSHGMREKSIEKYSVGFYDPSQKLFWLNKYNEYVPFVKNKKNLQKQFVWKSGYDKTRICACDLKSVSFLDGSILPKILHKIDISEAIRKTQQRNDISKEYIQISERQKEAFCNRINTCEKFKPSFPTHGRGGCQVYFNEAYVDFKHKYLSLYYLTVEKEIKSTLGKISYGQDTWNFDISCDSDLASATLTISIGCQCEGIRNKWWVHRVSKAYSHKIDKLTILEIHQDENILKATLLPLMERDMKRFIKEISNDNERVLIKQ